MDDWCGRFPRGADKRGRTPVIRRPPPDRRKCSRGSASARRRAKTARRRTSGKQILRVCEHSGGWVAGVGNGAQQRAEPRGRRPAQLGPLEIVLMSGAYGTKNPHSRSAMIRTAGRLPHTGLAQIPAVPVADLAPRHSRLAAPRGSFGYRLAGTSRRPQRAGSAAQPEPQANVLAVWHARALERHL